MKQKSCILNASKDQVALVFNAGEPGLPPGAASIHYNLVRIIALLPDNCRHAFYWAVVEGLPVGEIALRQGCSILSVHNDLSYALRHIRRNVTSYRLIISACDGTDPRPASKPTAKSQLPKANGQPPKANCQPPTAKGQPPKANG